MRSVLVALTIATPASAQTGALDRAVDTVASGGASSAQLLGSIAVILGVAVVALFWLLVREKDARREDGARYVDMAIKASDALVRSGEALKANQEALSRRGGP